MKKSIYVLAVAVVIATLMISSTASIPILRNTSITDNNIGATEITAAPMNNDGFVQRLKRLLTGEIIDIDISDTANINPNKINDNVVTDITLIWSETHSQYIIPEEYNVVDAGSLMIEHLPNLVAKLGGMSKALIEEKVKRLVIKVETYDSTTMNTFSGPCWTAPGMLSEDAGKARWDLEFKNADGSSYATMNWKLLIVTTYLN